MIALTNGQLSEIEEAAEKAYPVESCGLIVGSMNSDGYLVATRVLASKNLAAGKRPDRFEIDPQLRFDLMRELRGGVEKIIGHYHSHPDHPARPSETDAAMAYEMDLIWIITAVQNGKAADTAAYRPLPTGGFEGIELTIQ